MWLVTIDNKVHEHSSSLYWSFFWDQAISLLRFKTLPHLYISLIWLEWWWRTIDKEDWGGKEGEREATHDDDKQAAVGDNNWFARPTRLGERRCSTELLPHHHPPVLTNRAHCTLIPSQAQSFLLQVSSKPTEKGEEGGRPLGLGYNPSLCLSLL